MYGNSSRWRPLLWPGRYSEQFRRVRSRARPATYTTQSWHPSWSRPRQQLQTAVEWLRSVSYAQLSHAAAERRLFLLSLSSCSWSVVIRIRPIPSRCPIPDTIGHSYADTNTGLYNFFYWKCDFVRGIGVCRLYMYTE